MSHVLMHEAQMIRVRHPARLKVLAGEVWLTREGDPDDYLLAPGESLAVAGGERLWLGRWHADQAALWDWDSARVRLDARRYVFLRDLAAAALGLVERALLGTAAGLAALARSAAATACRAQGCIRAGESIASAGTVQ
jgi:hypothetical protein